jgi:heat shock protein HslJ/uncharacterized protein YraI
LARALAVSILLFATGATVQASDWRILSVDGVAAQGTAEMTIGDEGELAGTVGCNRFSGEGRYAEGVLEITRPFAATRMACVDPAIAAQEQAMLSLLQGSVETNYDPYVQELALFGNDHRAVLQPASLSGGYGMPAIFDAEVAVVTGITSRLNLRVEPSTNADVVAQLRAGSSNENLGCERRNDRDWCRLRVDDGVEGWAAAEFLVPLTLGSRAKDGEYDQIGRLACADPADTTAERCEYGATREGERAIISVFIDRDAPAVLHFRSGEFDPAASFGPFVADTGTPQPGNEGITLVIDGVRLDIPSRAIQP